MAQTTEERQNLSCILQLLACPNPARETYLNSSGHAMHPKGTGLSKLLENSQQYARQLLMFLQNQLFVYLVGLTRKYDYQGTHTSVRKHIPSWVT